MKEYNEEELNNTIAALLLFSNDFGVIVDHLALGISFYKILSILKHCRHDVSKEEFKEKIDENVKFYTEKLCITVAQIQDDLYEMGEEDDIFNFHFIRRSSKLIGKICDELLNKHGYGDVAALSKNSNGVDLSDFFVPLDEDDDECEDDADETNY